MKSDEILVSAKIEKFFVFHLSLFTEKSFSNHPKANSAPTEHTQNMPAVIGSAMPVSFFHRPLPCYRRNFQKDNITPDRLGLAAAREMIEGRAAGSEERGQEC